MIATRVQHAVAAEAADADCIEPAHAAAMLAGAPWKRLVVALSAAAA